MIRKEILAAFREGKLSAAEARERLRRLQLSNACSLLSSGQQGLWMLQKMVPDMYAYNVPLCFRILQQLDIQKLKQAYTLVIEQQLVLTSIILEENGLPYQEIRASMPLAFLHEDISMLPVSDVLAALKQRARRPFSLKDGPLMRINVLSCTAQEHYVLVTVHHIIFDGSSSLIFLQTLLDAYSKLIHGEKPVHNIPQASYADFVAWEQSMLASEDGKGHRAYWLRQMGGTLPTLNLPLDRPRSVVQSFSGQAYSQMLPPDLSQHIKAFAQTYHVNLATFFLGLFKVLLFRYTGQQDIILGMPTMGRPQERFEELIGYFVNMIPIRSELSSSQAFLDLLHSLQLTLIEGLDHAFYPFPVLVYDLQLSRSHECAPVFQVIFSYQNFLQSQDFWQLQAHYQEKLSLSLVEEIHQEGEYELELEVFERESGFTLNLKYNPDLFESATIQRMMTHYINLAVDVIRDPTRSLDTYALLTSEERLQLLVDWNETAVAYPQVCCIHTAFELQAQAIPDALALVYGQEHLTYGVLHQRVTRLAYYLRGRGIVSGSLVGICMERSIEMVVAILGILKAGGVYVPLDPAYSSERLAYIINDSASSLVLTQEHLKDKLAQMNMNGSESIALDTAWHIIEQAEQSGLELDRENDGSHLAYVIYTSGSTGRPKGVIVKHSSVMNTLYFLEASYPVTTADKYILKTNFAFDVSLSELCGWFMGRGHLVILPPGGEKLPEMLAEYIKIYAITHINFVPAMLSAFLQSIPRTRLQADCSLKYVMVAGEAFPRELMKEAVETFRGAQVENLYGPTEASIYAARFSCSGSKLISANTPIGRPIANTKLYIVDHHLQLVPIDIAGELCIAGIGLALGYLKQPDLTAEKFVDNPFQPGTKLYRTGDIARWLPDGTIEYLGRVDSQMKIRGFRIELGEIESQLGTHPEVRECVVVVNESKQLLAFYVPLQASCHDGMGSSQMQDIAGLRNYLSARLPEYMLPSFFIPLAQIPLTANGKVDRSRLAHHDLVLTHVEPAQEPGTTIEKQVLEIWQAVLNVEGIGTEDGFFEVGGDSILAVAATERLKKAFHCDMSVTAVFKYPNIKELSAYITQIQGNQLPRDGQESELTDGDQQGISSQVFRVGRTVADQRRTVPSYYEESIAIIGVACRFPGARNHTEFWHNLCSGKESVRFFSAEELQRVGLPNELISDPHFVPIQSTMEGKDTFDPGFFAITPRDAEFMDPQFRMLLLHSWHALEDAGYTAKQIPETSVFMSASSSYYQALLPHFTDAPIRVKDADEYVSWILAQGGTIPTMISYKLGLKGPSVFVHSNCSSSLVGMHLAVRSLLAGEAKYALVGGTTLYPTSYMGYLYENGLNFSSDGHCKAFDAAADGMIGGEGVAVVLLKKALDAVKDGDHIYALVRGISVNNDGAEKVGFYAPSAKGQAEVIRKVLESTQIHPETISYVEAHGTGTRLGDSIEFTALSETYRQYTAKKQFCGIGSVKTNMGHLDTVAGLAGCLKVVLSLSHNEIPPSLHYKNSSPESHIEDSPFFIVDTLRRWTSTDDAPHRAALSSFGLGGTNAHAIFEQYRVPERDVRDSAVPDENRHYLVPLSAKNKDRLQVYVQNLLEFLQPVVPGMSNLGQQGDAVQDGALMPGGVKAAIHLADLAYTLQVGREAMNSRVAFIVKDLATLIAQLKAFLYNHEDSTGFVQGETGKTNTPWQSLEQDPIYEYQLTKWRAGQDLHKLAQLWISGLTVDWPQLYFGLKPLRMSLPVYPFAEERYWPKVVSRADGKQVSPPIQSKYTASAPEISSHQSVHHLLLFTPTWQEQSEIPQTRDIYRKHIIICCESRGDLQTHIEARLPEAKCVYLQSDHEDVAQRFHDYASQLLDILQGLIAQQEEGKVLLQLVISLRDEDQLCSGLFGLLRTAHLENPRFVSQLLEMSPKDDGVRIAQRLQENSWHSGINLQYPTTDRGNEENQTQPPATPSVDDSNRTTPSISSSHRASPDGFAIRHIRYRNGRPFILGWQEIEGREECQRPWRDDGVYLITGGAGGLGSIFAEEIVRQARRATVVLIGRSPLSVQKQVWLKALNVSGARVTYQQTDITDAAQVKALCEDILHRYGVLHGIIHAAGVLQDSYIFKKSKEALQKVLAPKVLGTYHLDNATRDLFLDFFVLFSSGVGSVGNIGQADYAMANAFMDAFAAYRNQLVALQQRHGRTLAIGWPWWQDGGMQVDAETLDTMRSRGIYALQKTNGIRAFYQSIASGLDQILVLEGDPNLIRKHLLETVQAYSTTKPDENSPRTALNDLRAKTLYQLKKMFCQMSKLAISQLDIYEPLEAYGIDSMMVTRLNKQLGAVFGELSQTLLYEYQTLNALAEYLLTHHFSACLAWSDVGTRMGASPVPTVPIHDVGAGLAPAHGLASGWEISNCLLERKLVSAHEHVGQDAIAIIGISGRYPQARGLTEFWHNLQTGQNCISEIPEERWPLEDFYLSQPEAAIAQGKSYGKWGGFLDGFAEFDPLFFNISPWEATNIDPQERLFIEACWEVLEDAGYTRERISAQYGRRVGVFAGITKTGFDLYGPDLWRRGKNVFPHTSFSSLANRVSYLLNLQGPSMPIDTMCSASLTAIHEACEHLKRDECELAIAGGVNLYLHPSSYVFLSMLHMLSTDGQCRSFGQGGDGFVPGEGVGCVLLKSLTRAIKDGDHIYGIIRGTSINHGGKTNGYTVPNPTAQAELVSEVLKRAGVNARAVSYIEAHGTGTELGDPIEIAGLTQAFHKDTQDLGFCSIGSVKSNIGHLEAAAGIASVTKVLLQMKHRQLVPSLHVDKPNPNIHFDQTPFVVQQELTEWKRPLIEVDGQMREYPRIAGISSFGAGGSNAHIIIEEYMPEETKVGSTASLTGRSVLIILSAKSEEQLQEQALQLLTALEEEPFANSDLDVIAYTLQVGREAMEERLGLLVKSLAELVQNLHAIVGGEEGLPNLYRGKVKSHREIFRLFSSDEDMANIVAVWMEKGKYENVLELWVKGMAVDWEQLYRGHQPRRVSLPTYPFSRERYWLSPQQRSSVLTTVHTPGDFSNAIDGMVAYLHPLLHRNTSDLTSQRYSSTFSGREFFLRDHQIEQRAILPAVAALELARAAVQHASGEQDATLTLTQVVWIRPVAVAEEPLSLEIQLEPQQDGSLHYQLVGTGLAPIRTGDRQGCEGASSSSTLRHGDALEESKSRGVDDGFAPSPDRGQPYPPLRSPEAHMDHALTFTPMGQDQPVGTGLAPFREGEPLLYSQGQAYLSQKRERPQLDVEELRKQCQRARWSGQDCYDRYEQMGLCYGAGMRALQGLEVGEGQVVGQLELPASVQGTHEQYVLHPSLLDGALQTALGLLMGVDSMEGEATLQLPYVLEQLEIYAGTETQMWAWVRRSPEEEAKRAAKGVQRLDIDLCDKHGQVCAQLRGLVTRPVVPSYLVRPTDTILAHEPVKGRNLSYGEPKVFTTPSSTETSVTSSTPVKGKKLFREKVLAFLKEEIAPVIQLPAAQIEADAPLEKYGIDSILALRLTNQLEKRFGTLPKTLFFEYQTISELSAYFLEVYHDVLQALLGRSESEAAPVSSHSDAIQLSQRSLVPVVSRLKQGRVQMNRSQEREPAPTALDVAIIGLAGRYPGAKSLRQFWENLRAGKDCVSEIPVQRWDQSRYYNPDKHARGSTYSKWGGFLEGVDLFDPLFFNIAPREAEIMDPQERLFLQCVYETLEDAGYTRQALAGKEKEVSRVGVYVGVMYEEYQLYGAQETLLGRPMALGGSPSSIANRVSYFCNFHGPSVAVDTMCSSSLTAIHLACQSLRQGECALAIAGGVNLSLHPNKYLMLAQGKFASSTGRCESFGRGGDGYVPAEGVGAVLLKPLEQARADGDQIYGVIKGSAINHGGKTNGYSVPNPVAQADVIDRALKQAGIEARQVSYVEAHGTGTVLGDPIEIAALSRVYGPREASQPRCAIGSVKSNIGHAESAAGIAGLTKVLLQMKYGELVPSLHAQQLNPHIDFARSAFEVQQELVAWARRESRGRQEPRRAEISSFGAGGSNAHMVVEEYWEEEMREEPEVGGEIVIVLSAKREGDLREKAQRLLEMIERGEIGERELRSVAYTLQVGREAMEERWGAQMRGMEELRERLKSYVAGEPEGLGVYRGQVRQHRETLNVIKADEDMEKALAVWMEKKKYEKLLDLWVKGMDVDWEQLYRGKRPRRISLPTYPFARERYWLLGDHQTYAIDIALHSGVGSTLHEESTMQRKTCFLEKRWEPCAITPTERAVDQPVAILTTPDTRELAVRLQQFYPQGEIVNLHDLEVLLQQQDHSWPAYIGYIDLIGCGYHNDDTQIWISWLQRCLSYSLETPITLLCVTQALEAFQNAAINLAGALHAGLSRMLQAEYRQVRARHIDLEPTNDLWEQAQQIANEFCYEDRHVEVCYRGGQRYQAYLGEYQIEHDDISPQAFPADHVLWITGGTRGLGYVCAQHFVEHYGVKRLVLTGREQLPPQETWEEYAQQETVVAQKIRNIRALEERGVDVCVLAVSLHDDEALYKALQHVKATLGPVGGLFHCAGLSDADNPAFIRKTPAEIQRIFQPKVAGLNALYRVFSQESLRFFVLFSSVSAVIPVLAAGQSDYATSNAYMDYFAEAHRHTLPLVSIQWPSWQETGIGAVKSQAYQQTGLLTISNDEGMRLLDIILARKSGPVVLPAVIDPSRWQSEGLMQYSRLEHPPVSSSSYMPIMNKMQIAGDARRRRVHARLKEIFAYELKIDETLLEIDQPFHDYGMDSVLVAQALRTINKWLGVEIDPSILYEYPTIDLFTTWLIDNNAEIVDAALHLSAPTPVPVGTEACPCPPSPVGTLPITARDRPYGPCPPAIFSYNVDGLCAKQDSQESRAKDIAIVGLTARFPGAPTLGDYWTLLAEGQSAIRAVPADRWGYPNQFYAGLLDTITHFDPGFFLIADEDARAMDPQALMILEESLKLWYQAGYTHEEIKGKSIGVYIGARSSMHPNEASLMQTRNPVAIVGQNYLAANVSRFFDLHGPSIVIDTACSSALVGANMAIQALLSKEVEAALVGGVSLLSTDGTHRLFQQRDILSKQGSFHIFDGRADGIVLGEGIGMVLLKTVEQALMDGDSIYAVIKAISVNNDGRTAGPAAPNLQAQKEVMQTALIRSGKSPTQVSYIEANGSGSSVTDLIELKAIQAVYRSSDTLPCIIGSVKPNIGHPLCAEGIAGLIKIVLMLQHRQIVPFLSGKEPMTHYDIQKTALRFSEKLTDWHQQKHVAALNCFADGGTNVHAILESYEPPQGYCCRHCPLPLPDLALHEVYGDRVWHTPADRGQTPLSSEQTGGQVLVSTKGQENISPHQQSTNIWKRMMADRDQIPLSSEQTGGQALVSTKGQENISPHQQSTNIWKHMIVED